MTKKPTDNLTATILRIQRMSTEDGPGIRSTVFFKGCPLSCVWCHNPESISHIPQVHWTSSRCIGCLSCIDACPQKALSAERNGIAIDRTTCIECMACTRACPSTALEAYGVVYGSEELVTEVLKDRVYFEKSGGGVTLSGGEPTFQGGFALAVLKSLRAHGVHTALDTCGQCSWETLEGFLPYADMVLYDLKEVDPERHKAYTGTGNARILENLVLLGTSMREHGRPGTLWIRTPLIPGYTASTENLRGIGSFIREHLGQLVGRWELCSFNNLCQHKYDSLGIPWRFKGTDLLMKKEAERLAAIARSSVADAGLVHLSGPLRREDIRETVPDKPVLSVVKGGCI
ncbi:MAG TPA: glycyl-radical enzyme activating protein [Deltaproteobacteria bacterium]|nr:glycyl-radical enzyme activating protein [Deltaproteobacteria bacterium]HPR54206.1 glycyl-radical enzyme activating protein [Deltaproteobacteria bacterium]HXK45883.1 glycyl-radical enzyme activating protein [Deltaproteobacteria bacterium]